MTHRLMATLFVVVSLVAGTHVGQLRGQNVTIDTVKLGDHVVVAGDPSRTPGELRLRMRTISRPSDGWKWGGEVD